MQYLKLLLCSGLLVSASYSSEAQLLKKLKQKAENVADKIVDKKIDEKINGKGNTGGNNPGGNTGPGMPGSGASGGGGRNNTSGEGLVTTPPDVQKNLTEAEDAFKKNSLNESRYSIRQAMLGVEMEIGKKILKNLPPKVKNLSKDSAEDKVTSSGWGWVGLMIQGAYKAGEQELRLTIANNAAWMQAVNMYLANGGYAQSSGDQQNWKQTKLKGYRAVIEFDKSSGYKLSVPLGQTSMIIFEGINFKTEQEMMDACSVIDIDGIKKELGEK